MEVLRDFIYGTEEECIELYDAMTAEEARSFLLAEGITDERIDAAVEVIREMVAALLTGEPHAPCAACAGSDVEYGRCGVCRGGDRE